MILIFGFHSCKLIVLLGFGNHLSNLAFLVAFGVVALVSRDGDDAFDFGVFKLTVGGALAVELEACFSEVGEEVSDLFGRGWELGWRGGSTAGSSRQVGDQRLRASATLLASFAFLAIHHRFDAAGLDLLGGEGLFLGGFYDGGFLDVAALSCSQVVGGF